MQYLVLVYRLLVQVEVPGGAVQELPPPSPPLPVLEVVEEENNVAARL